MTLLTTSQISSLILVTLTFSKIFIIRIFSTLFWPSILKSKVHTPLTSLKLISSTTKIVIIFIKLKTTLLRTVQKILKLKAFLSQTLTFFSTSFFRSTVLTSSRRTSTYPLPFVKSDTLSLTFFISRIMTSMIFLNVNNILTRKL